MTCPDCGNKRIIETQKDGKLLCECENCDWSIATNDFFYITAWYVELDQALAPIDILNSMLTGADISKVVKRRIQGKSYLSNFREAPDEYFEGEIRIAHQVYLRQMIVLAVTYLEQMLKDYFRCELMAFPNRMNKYLSNDGRGKAFISLNEVIDESSKESLLRRLAERAATHAVDPRFDRIIEKIVSDYHIDVRSEIQREIREFVELRNRIVHDATKEEVSIEKVYEAFELNHCILYILAIACDANQIPYYDETGFLDNYKEYLMIHNE